MYSGIRRESPMNNISAHSSMNSLSAQSRTIAFIALCLFAFSGLISGFAVGAFVRPNFALPSSQKAETTPVAQKTETPSKGITQSPIPLAPPTISSFNTPEVADGTTAYTFSSQVVDKQGKSVHASDITCRLWLLPMAQNPRDIPLDRLKSPSTLQSSPLPGEIQALIFDPTTAQTQACNANGQGTWKYHLDPSINPGQYYLVVLTDWNGVHYNWSWDAVTIKKPGQ